MLFLLAALLIAAVVGGLMTTAVAAKVFLVTVGVLAAFVVLFMLFATILALCSSRINPR